MALESKYHLSCLAKLQNCHRSYLRENEEIFSTMNEERKIEARAVAELLSHIETSVQEGTFLFKFSELRALYSATRQRLPIKFKILILLLIINVLYM